MNNPFRKLTRVTLKTLLVAGILLVGFVVYFIMAIKQNVPEIADRSAERLTVKTTGTDFKKCGKSWLKKSNSGLWEMYLEGNGFERGIINGKLTKDLAEYQETVFINQIKVLVPSEKYLNVLKYFVAYFNRHIQDHITKEYKDEIYGVSLSASDKFDKMAPKYYRILNYHSAHDIGHALQDKNMTVGCTSFGAWGDKTKDGKILLGRNFDFFAGDDFAKNKIVCFTKPDSGYKFMYVTWAGFTGVVSGMNDKGLTVTLNASKSDIPKSAATPISLLAKEILQYAKTIDEAYAIAKKRQTFVSESILIGSAIDKRVATIEKSPLKISLYSEKGDQLICSNHYKSVTFEKDYINNKNMVESSSLYRDFRMKQLLKKNNSITEKEVAIIMRDQNGLNDRAIGLTNEKGINQLLAHHSIIFKPEDGLVWISTSPYQLGKYVCYNLNTVFNEAPAFSENREIQDTNQEIAADPFLSSIDYLNFLRYKKMRNLIEFCTKSNYQLAIDERYIHAFINSNANYYYTYWIVGDYYLKMKNKTRAITCYNQALTKEVATQKEADKLKNIISELNKPSNQ